MKEWTVHRPGLRYVLAQLMWSDAFGSAYRHARDGRGRVRRFWTEKGAQAAADQLNAASLSREGGEDE